MQQRLLLCLRLAMVAAACSAATGLSGAGGAVAGEVAAGVVVAGDGGGASAVSVVPVAEAAGAVALAAEEGAAFDSQSIARALRQKRSPLLLSFAYDDAAVRAMVLERFPVGTPRAAILKAFPEHFAVFDWRYYGHNGLWVGSAAVQRRNYGTHVLTFTVFQDFPLGLNVPFVLRRYVEMNFDGGYGSQDAQDARLLDLRVARDVDAP